MTDDDVLRQPIHDGNRPIVCTLGAAELPDHLDLLDHLSGQLVEVQRTPHGVVLWFAPSASIAGDVHRFTEMEKRCCQFWGFDVIETDRTGLRWDGPPELAGFMDQLVRDLEDQEPLSALFARWI